MSRIRSRALLWLALVLFMVWTLAPIVWAIVSSLFPTAALTSTPMDLSLDRMTLKNFAASFTSRGPNLLEAMRNSLLIAVIASCLGVIIGAPAGYALANLGIRRSGAILMAVLASQMFPAIVLVIPLFVVLAGLGLVGTYAALIIVHLTFIVPIVIWVTKGFFEAIPPQLEKSAAIDGANMWNTFRLIVFPLAAPSIFAVGVFAFIESWNEFFFAVILSSSRTKTVPVTIAEFSGQFQTLYGEMIAASVISSIPVVLLAIVFRRYLVEGFVEGSVKG
ncbi:carbohydrate ABC transporter permease [Mycobacterium sp. 21AC1]|uniref:carbohydrate ABC transporter permease n=1 Tax=[Mycobacterium] appelbergii TaxID=2939269 RepID=UPI002939363C|nr:carbohydrate ABC transporter permease [Mycobacterium sp. 21AC1]MDV3125999.1 carbohydrate ABC transporter permease [Mycobacterium sp. 21AC1]